MMIVLNWYSLRYAQKHSPIDLSKETLGPVQAERRPQRSFVIQGLPSARVEQKFVRNRPRYCREADESRVIARLARRQERSYSVWPPCNTSRANLQQRCRASFLQYDAFVIASQLTSRSSGESATASSRTNKNPIVPRKMPTANLAILALISGLALEETSGLRGLGRARIRAHLGRH